MNNDSDMSNKNSKKRWLSNSEVTVPIDKKVRSTWVDPIELLGSIGSESESAEMEAKLDAILKSITEVKSDIADVKKDVGQLKTLEPEIQRLNTTLISLQDSINKQEQKFDVAFDEINSLKSTIPDLRMEVSELKKKNENLEEKLLHLDEYSRRENLVLEGIKESGLDEDCFKSVYSVLEQVGLKKFQFQRCHRLGRYKPGITRAIIVRFVLFQEKMEVVKKRDELRTHKVLIHDDFPPEISAQRAKLRPVLRYLRDKGEEAYLIRDKLKHKDILYGVEEISLIPYDLTSIGTKITDSHVYFAGEFSPLSNLYPCKITHKDKTYIGVEQFYEREKYLNHHDEIGAEKVMNCKTNREAMEAARSLKVTKIWKEKVAYETMAQILKMKFEQVPEFKQMILDNKGKEFIEATTNITWGIGVSIWSKELENKNDWKGENKMGEALKRLAV